jgi:hypothetical protein
LPQKALVAIEFQAAVAKAIKIKPEDAPSAVVNALKVKNEAKANNTKNGKLPATDKDGNMLPGFVTEERLKQV